MFFYMFELHCSYISKLKLKNIALDGIGFFSNFFLLLSGWGICFLLLCKSIIELQVL